MELTLPVSLRFAYSEAMKGVKLVAFNTISTIVAVSCRTERVPLKQNEWALHRLPFLFLAELLCNLSVYWTPEVLQSLLLITKPAN